MRSFHLPGRSTAHAENGMCTTSSPLATLAGVDVLRRGGNAIDAAVTMSAMLLVTEPHMTGIGGDCFAIIGKPDGSLVGLNGSGRASMRADADWLAASGLDDITSHSIHAVTVPGAIDAWDRLLADHGTISLGEALAPAIEAAETGVPVTPRVAHDWPEDVDLLKADEGARKHYLIDDRAPRVGERFRVPALAQTLRTIAETGRDAFYEGEIAEKLVTFLESKGSLLSLDDFAATQATYVDPISTAFRGREICEIPPNGQGITALIMLNILDRLGLDAHAPDSVERYHFQIEAARLAYELRNRHVADPGSASVPVEYLLSDALADELAARIDPKRAIDDVPDTMGPRYSETIYLSVVDKDRTAVSFINSVFSSFGIGIAEPETAILLHNRGWGFVADPAHPNCIGPGKRPLHTIIPAMVREGGKVVMPYGVMGASYQPMGHVQVALNMYVWGMDIQEALDFPRFFPREGVCGLEEGVPEDVARALAELGHTVARTQGPWGGGQGVVIDWEGGMLTGGSDPRKDGIALGY